MSFPGNKLWPREKYLVEAAARDLNFDFIFVDGDHGTGHTLADTTLSTAVLAPDGIICSHDSFFRSTSMAIPLGPNPWIAGTRQSARLKYRKKRIQPHRMVIHLENSFAGTFGHLLPSLDLLPTRGA